MSAQSRPYDYEMISDFLRQLFEELQMAAAEHTPAMQPIPEQATRSLQALRDKRGGPILYAHLVQRGDEPQHEYDRACRTLSKAVARKRRAQWRRLKELQESELFVEIMRCIARPDPGEGQSTERRWAASEVLDQAARTAHSPAGAPEHIEMRSRIDLPALAAMEAIAPKLAARLGRPVHMLQAHAALLLALELGAVERVGNMWQGALNDEDLLDTLAQLMKEQWQDNFAGIQPPPPQMLSDLEEFKRRNRERG